jgi:hypothetical protein
MSSTDNITLALILIASISLVFVLVQMSITDINPDSGMVFYNCSNDFLSNSFTASECTAGGEFAMRNPDGSFPTPPTGTVSPSTGNIFSDTYLTAQKWLLESTGLGYVGDLLSAPKNFLVSIGVPNAVAFLFAAMWYMLMLFLLVSWLLGR